MPSPIKFNGKTGIMTVEVEDISAHRNLSTKLETTEAPPPQDIPKKVLCISLLFTKLSGKNEQFWWHRHHCPLTLTLSLRERGLV